MNIWKSKKLKELDGVEIILGQSPSSKSYNKNKYGLPFLQGKAEFGMIYPKPKIFTDAPLKIAESNDLLLSVRAPVGDINLSPYKLCIGRGLAAIRFKKDNPKFYFYWFLKNQKHIESLGVGSTFKAITGEQLKKIEIPVVELSEQTAIANILSIVDEAIQKADEAITKAERIKQAMMKKLLSEGIGHKEFKQTKIGKIPKDWEVVRLNRYANILGGFAFKSSDYAKIGIPLIRIANVSFGEIVFEDLAYLPKTYLDKFNEYKVKKDDILLALTRPIISGGLKASIINSEHTPALLNQRVAKINTRDEKQVQQNYLKHFVLSPYFFKQMLQAQTSTNQPNVSTRQIEGFHIIIPDPVEQKNISDILEEVQNKVKLSIKRKNTLEKIKQGLMDDLLTGKKRVKIN